MNDYPALSEMLSEALELRQPPVAISFTSAVPAGLQSHTGRVPAGCRFWQDGASRAFATSASDHSLCSIGVYTHNLHTTPAQQVELMDALEAFGELGYVTQQDLPLIPVLRERSTCIVYSPLAQAPLPPDVVLLFVNASQTLILSEATGQVEGQHAPAMGRPACAVVPQVMNTGRAALSLGCCGARAYLDTLTDDVAVFALPGAKLEAYTRRIQCLAQANKTLLSFHQIRRHTIAAGGTPSIKDSLAALAP